MSADEYTPTMHRIRDAFANSDWADVGEVSPSTIHDGYRWFDEALAAHDAEVARAAKAEALEEAAMRADDDWGEFAYVGADGLVTFATVPEMLEMRAAEYRKVATDE